MGRVHPIVCLLVLSSCWVGCIALPANEPERVDVDEPDSAVVGVALDAGPVRPPTAPPYSGPQCAPVAGQNAPAAEQGPDSGRPQAGGSGEAAPWAGAMADASLPGQDAATSEPAVDPASHLPRPERGYVVITELMIDPKAIDDTDGEWIELWNPGTVALDLTGCQLDDGGSAVRALPDLSIAPRQWLVIARAAQPGLVPDATLSLSWTNSMDRAALVCDGVVIDEVAYGPGFPLVAGASLSLDPSFANADDNDVAEAWCAASAAFGADRGTPGTKNPPCAPPDADAGAP